MDRLAVVDIAQLVTCAGPGRPRVGPEMSELFVLEGAAFLVDDGRIRDVDFQPAIEAKLTPETTVVSAQGGCVLPGFVDAHAHPVFAGNRVEEFELRARGATYEEIAAKGGGIQSTVAKTRAATDAELLAEGRRHLNWALRCGTTTMEAKSGYGLTLADEVRMLKTIRELDQQGPMRLVPTFLGAHACPPEVDLDRYVEEVCENMLPAVVETDLAKWCDVFCERGYFDLAASRKILARAKALGLGLRVHADQLSNCGGAMLAAELGAKTADHLEQVDGGGIAAMKAAGVQPVVLPASVYALGKTKYPPAREMIDAGLALVLATDLNPGSSPTPSIPMAMSLACTQMRMTPAEAICAATINAAYSLDLGHRLGSIEPGKVADFAVFDVPDHREIAYWFGETRASAVYVGGRRILPAA